MKREVMFIAYIEETIFFLLRLQELSHEAFLVGHERFFLLILENHLMSKGGYARRQNIQS
jgi:hypothetical protein